MGGFLNNNEEEINFSGQKQIQKESVNMEAARRPFFNG